MTLDQIIDFLRNDKDLKDSIIHWRTYPPRPARYADYPTAIDTRLINALKARGVEQLYTHQAESIQATLRGDDVVVVTPTASGKTLCYNLPVLNDIMRNPETRALYLFPTKALSQDQMSELYDLIQRLDVDIKTYTFDGDTPQTARRLIRAAGHIVITNPDMLHAGVLPHHTKWIKLFENLKYVVIDEVHQYRGVFGSHLANVIRRLMRICRFYGSNPQFICCSATIANPDDLARRIIGRPVTLIDNNGAPGGEKHFLVYNPPVVNKQLGIRRSSINEAASLAAIFLRHKIQTIVFAHFRLYVEVLLTYLQRELKGDFGKGIEIAGYRGGYLPNERRRIEAGLRSGSITGVVSTNALELGVDIGSLDVSIIVGYPGSVASLWQQAGRAGRRSGTSLTIMVANSSAINQFLCTEPKYIFERTPESGIIDPDNLIIRTNHLKCATFELPYGADELEGDEDTRQILDYLADENILRQSNDRFHWSSEIYPAQGISLRSASPENFVILNESNNSEVIGEVDYFSAPIFLHPEAIYLHAANQFQVTKLDWEGKKAYVKEVEVDYYTDAETKSDLKVLSTADESGDESRGTIHHGEVSVTCVTVLFKKIKFQTHENVGSGPLVLPELEMHTNAFWYSFPVDIAETLELNGDQFGGSLRGLANILGKIAPLWVMCDPRDLRSISQVRAPFTERPTVYVYENIPGGVGLSEKLFGESERLFEACREHVRRCSCVNGCPTCVGPAMEVGATGKDGVIKLLDYMMAVMPV
ncbi:ATP-dependent helicase [candidate division GN15 bacterium]|uniref:ATP-dependent helicase n=1 Tax=candidate division GN15 bacterium TaxID=2072418 RepID=A0A855X425_9BACT|nr:MAG: ATP-dependent helicase [candidate division GN15 bacterium]